jgi:hypothetical protein
MTFEFEEAAYLLELLPGEELPDVAVRMLDAGFDSQAVRELAGLSRPTRRDAGKLFEEALLTVRTQPMTIERAGEVVRHRILWRIASGDLAPLAGAEAMSRHWHTFGGPAELSKFIYLHDIAEEYPAKRSAAESEIVELARQLVRQWSARNSA